LDTLANKDDKRINNADQSRKSIQINLEKIEIKRNEVVNIDNNLNSFNNDKIDFWKEFCIKFNIISIDQYEQLSYDEVENLKEEKFNVMKEIKK